LVDLSQSVHLLHVLPIGATENTGARLEHLDVVKPQLSSVNIDTYGVKHELVGLRDCSPICAALVSGQVEATSDEVDVSRVNAYVLSRRDGAAEELLHLWQLVELRLKGNVLDPLLSLDKLATSHDIHQNAAY
jgi:hypothetical protein